MERYHWIYCPICDNKTRMKIREDTEIKNFPLYCPKCRQESLINVKILIREGLFNFSIEGACTKCGFIIIHRLSPFTWIETWIMNVLSYIAGTQGFLTSI